MEMVVKENEAVVNKISKNFLFLISFFEVYRTMFCIQIMKLCFLSRPKESLLLIIFSVLLKVSIFAPFIVSTTSTLPSQRYAIITDLLLPQNIQFQYKEYQMVTTPITKHNLNFEARSIIVCLNSLFLSLSSIQFLSSLDKCLSSRLLASFRSLRDRCNSRMLLTIGTCSCHSSGRTFESSKSTSFVLRVLSGHFPLV